MIKALAPRMPRGDSWVWLPIVLAALIGSGSFTFAQQDSSKAKSGAGTPKKGDTPKKDAAKKDEAAKKDDGKPGEARDLMRAAYAHAARGVSPEQRSWLHAVDAAVEAKIGDGRRSVDLIKRAEDALTDTPSVAGNPDWLDFYDATRLNGFKGFCYLAGGQADQARESLLCSLMALKPNEAKQRTIVLADMAKICVHTKDVDEACRTLTRALENLDKYWYGMGWDRIVGVRKSLDPFKDTRMVRDLDNRMHGSWPGTMRLTA